LNLGKINLEKIIISSEKEIKRAGSRDAFIIATERKIKVRYEDLGSLMGMYKYYNKNNRYITLNQNNSRCARIVTCYHEIGHDVNDQDIAKNSLLQDIRWNMKDPTELRANLFAAETQLVDSEILEYISYGHTLEQIAMETGTYRDYIAMKQVLLRFKGYNVKVDEFNPYFFRVAEGKQNGEYYISC